ncbi:MAG: hypothetical protein ABI678_17800 [Kofleriaceae bacterium]
MRAFLRRAWPWLLGLVILAAILTRVPLAAFGDAIHEGPHLRLAAVDLAVVLALLLTDTFATWIALVVANVRWTLGRTLAVRGATYLLSLLNYAVGQGGIGYYLHRGGMSGLRSAGVTLFTMGTTLATLLLLTTGTWWASVHASNDAMWWTLVAGCIAFAIYLAIIAVRPGALAGRELLAPLFETGLSGHAIAIAARLPHVILIVLGHWFALLAWGIAVPFTAAATVMPVVVIAGVIPISPAGLGTIQGALVYFFSDYAPGATHEARAASLLAFSIVHFVYGMLGQLAVGVACIPLARKGDPQP